MKAMITIKKFGQPRTRHTREVELDDVSENPRGLRGAAENYVNQLNADEDHPHDWELRDVSPMLPAEPVTTTVVDDTDEPEVADDSDE
jgi:hypothetical protein